MHRSKHHLLLSIVTNILIVASIANNKVHAAHDLPVLGCPTFGTVEDARLQCTGTFYMWGESARAEAFGNETAHFGPYMCTSCPEPQFGYVCQDADCPKLHVSYSFDRPFNPKSPLQAIDPHLPQCPSLSTLVGEAPTCSDLQRVCETEGFGWLTVGESNNGGVGDYSCAACSEGHLDSTFDPDAPNLLKSRPMILLYVAVSLLLTIAIVADALSFCAYFRETEEKLARETMEMPSARSSDEASRRRVTKLEIVAIWWNDVALRFLGVVDAEGNRRKFKTQCCQNYACSCCTHSDRVEFACALFLSLAITVITGGGSLESITSACSFSGEAEELYDLDYHDGVTDAPIAAAYPYQFTYNDFLGDGGHGGSFQVLSQGHVVPELLVLFFLYSIDVLGTAMKRKGFMWFPFAAKAASLAMSVTLGVVVLVLRHSDWDTNDLIAVTILGWIIILFYVGPLIAASAWCFGRCLVLVGLLQFPEDNDSEEFPSRRTSLRRAAVGWLGLAALALLPGSMLVLSF